MRRILKLNNIPIWNLADLQLEFSPIAAYDQLQDFCSFAKIHCVPLPQVLKEKDSEEWYVAKYFTKNFWHDILTRQDWPEKVNSPEECLEALVLPLFEKEIGGKDAADAVQAEAEQKRLSQERMDAAVSEKLNHIVESAGLTLDAGDIRKAVILLAICQLAEVNPLKQSFRIVQVQEITKPVTQELPHVTSQHMDEPEKEEILQPKAHQIIALFPFEKTAALVASDEPYRYWYHEEDTPQQGALIHTVCIKAQPGSRPNQVVHIELVSPSTGACIQEVTLKKGEFRYCNVSSGKIIGFLPDGTICSDLCLLRDSYAADHYTIMPNDADSWKLNQKGITMAAAASQQDGFLLLMDGKISTAFYKPAKDYMVQLQFAMIMTAVVEIQVTSDGCRILLEDGTVMCNGRKEKSRCVTLAGSRIPLKALDAPEVSQLAISEEQNALVVFRENHPPKVCYDSSEFKLKANRYVQLL